MGTSNNINYKNSSGSEGKTRGVFEQVTAGVKEIFDSNLHKSIPIIALIGYIVVSFSGYLVGWGDLFRYLIIVLASIFIYYLIYLIEAESKTSPAFMIEQVKSFYKYIKTRYIPHILFLFVNLYLFWCIYALLFLGNNLLQ